MFYFDSIAAHRDIHSFPTRRSSDLLHRQATAAALWRRLTTASTRGGRWRSEEHTSELQSRQYLVCRLLLEKKKSTTLLKLRPTHVPPPAPDSRPAPAHSPLPR